MWRNGGAYRAPRPRRQIHAQRACDRSRWRNNLCYCALRGGATRQPPLSRVIFWTKRKTLGDAGEVFAAWIRKIFWKNPLMFYKSGFVFEFALGGSSRLGEAEAAPFESGPGGASDCSSAWSSGPHGCTVADFA
jgi:hypothetical protein